MERLTAFRAVAREKNFSRAAEKIFRSQPAVSQAVQSLEREIGERLFMRQGRTAMLTQAGTILLEHVEGAFDTLDRARARIKALKELQEGTVTISASDTTACYFLPDVLKAFRGRYPGVEVCIRNRPSPIVVRQVAAHEADIGIVTLPIEHPRLTVEPLTRREDVAICSRGHRLARRSKVTIAELLAFPLLLLDRGSNTRSFVDQRLQRSGVPAKIAMELGSIEVIKKLVELDFGVSIVPRIAVQEDVKRGALHAMTVFPKTDWRTLGLVYPEQGILSLAGQVFAKMLKAHLQADATATSDD